MNFPEKYPWIPTEFRVILLLHGGIGRSGVCTGEVRETKRMKKKTRNKAQG
jgi:hypothetical protein